MSYGTFWSLLPFVAFSIATAYALTWVARIVAPKFGLVDRPDGHRKLHSRTTPLMGGVAVFVALAITVLACWSSGVFLRIAGSHSNSHVLALIFSAGIFCGVGLWDDRWAMRPRTKFLWQLFASLPFALIGPSIAAVQFLGIEIQLGPYGFLFVVLWVVSCANVVNLLDGLDGLAGTIGLIATSTMAILSLMLGDTSMSLLALIVAGSILGFLLHNFPPARIFLGDAGSLTIGFLVGALAIKTSQKTATCFTLIAPLVVLAVPIFDTMMAILRRKLTGKSIGSPDRGHIHHCLQDHGLSGKQALLTIALLCVLMAAASIFGVYFQSDSVAVLTCLAILTAMIAGRVFGYREITTLYQYTKAAIATFAEATSLVREDLRMPLLADPQSASPLPGYGDDPAREPDAPQWDELRRKAAEFGGVRLRLSYDGQEPNSLATSFQWSSDDQSATEEPMWSFEFSTLRNDNRRVNVTATGYSGEPHNEQLDDLVQVVQAICQGLPITRQHGLQTQDINERDRNFQTEPPRIISIDDYRQLQDDDKTQTSRRAA